MAERRNPGKARAQEGRAWLVELREYLMCKMKIILGLCFFLQTRAAFASRVQVDLLTIGQGYQTRTITGELLDRSRVTQWASLNAYGLWGTEGTSLDLQMRFDTDFGLWIDGKSDTSDLELMNFTLRMNELLPWLDVSLGRQVILDEIDFLELDAVRLHVHLPWGLKLGLLGGFAVRDRTWLGGGVLELDGVEQGDVPAPVIGASLGFFSDCLNMGMDYRRVMLWDDDWPIESERIAAWAQGSLLHRKLGVEAGATYDLAQDDFQRIHADAWVKTPWPWKGARIEAGFLQLSPHYSLDSIFNLFSPDPFWQVRIGLRVGLPEPTLKASARFGFYHRAYEGSGRWEGDYAGMVNADGQVNGFQIDGRLGLGQRGAAWVYAEYEDGAAGRRWLFSPGVNWDLLEDILSLNARAILLQVSDGYDSRYDLFNFGSSAGARWNFGVGRALIVTTEFNSNRINALSFRTLLVLDLSFAYGPGGYR